MKVILFILLSLSTSLFAKGEDTKFCEQRENKDKLADLLRKSQNLLTLQNNQGLFGLQTGVCWWHSRLQRRMTYLADFRPDLPKPTKREVKKILAQLKRQNKVIQIPGFANLRAFSKAHAPLIQKSLNLWMAGDSFFRMRWHKGLQGKSHYRRVKNFSAHMEDTYKQFVETDGLLVQVLQMAGPMAHAWLVVGMHKLSSEEYEIEVVDSNDPDNVARYNIRTDKMSMAPLHNQVKVITDGQKRANWHHPLTMYGDFVSYTEFSGELKHLRKAVKNHCEK